MYAVVSTVEVADPDEARLRLELERVALVARAPGLVEGYWLEPVDGVGLSVIVFEDKATADAAASYPVPPMDGVTVRNVRVREVFARARPR